MLNFGSDADITRIKIAAVLGDNKEFCENIYKYIYVMVHLHNWLLCIITGFYT